ncbi:MAG: PAS domain S-box protein [Methanoregula sp.]
MNFHRFFRNGDPVHYNRILALLLLTVITLGVNLFGIVYGLTAVLSHLLYLPTILASYWYPRRGLVFSAGIAVLYGILVLLFVPLDTMTGIATITRMAIIMLVGCVVAILSLNLAESEQKLQDIIEFLPDAVFAIDREGKVIAWNRAVEEMTGKEKADMLGKSDFEYSLAFYKERRPMLAGLILKNERNLLEKYPSIRRESSRLVSEAFLPHFNSGRGAHLRFSATPLMDNGGNIDGAIESVRDITDQVMTESALQNTSSRLNILSGILRHDMSRKLAVLYGQLQLGVMKFRDPDLIAFLGEMKESANSIKRQIDISREFRELGVNPPAWIPVQQAIFESAGRFDSGTVSIRSWTERLEVFSDPHLATVFYHILDNAIKESTGAKNVVVTYHIRKSGCVIIVEDDGTGIPDAEKGTLFLQQEENFGRGLFLAHEILSITGMTIRETGEYLKGARFEICVPSKGYRVTGMEA